MKRLICIFAILMGCLYSIPFTYCDDNFAQIANNHTYLYQNPESNKDMKNIICILENTYYVEILHVHDEDFYKVRYNGVTGYVSRSDVKRVSGVPNTPYPTGVTMKTISNNIYLRSTPAKGENTLSIIPANCTNLNYIGYTYGEQVDDFRENIWYYVNYLDVYGYVYGEYIESISQIPLNTQNLAFLNNDFEPIINPLSNGKCALIVTILTLPTLFILFLLYKKPKKNKKFKEHVVIIKEYDEKL